MPSKVFQLSNGLTVAIHKRKSSRHMRLSVTTDGNARVSIPAWAPYKVGLEFARSRQGWIKDHTKPVDLLADGQSVGKAHHLVFKPVSGLAKSIGRVSNTSIVVQHPAGLSANDAEVQQVARRTCTRALRLQAEQLLPQRLANLAGKYGFDYKNVTIKQLKRRWGSCDQHRQIVLNLFLMQLPWELIDYVLLHELTHTVVLQHGDKFWKAMERVLPSAKQQRKQLRQYQPQLG